MNYPHPQYGRTPFLLQSGPRKTTDILTGAWSGISTGSTLDNRHHAPLGCHNDSSPPPLPIAYPTKLHAAITIGKNAMFSLWVTLHASWNSQNVPHPQPDASDVRTVVGTNCLAWLSPSTATTTTPSPTELQHSVSGGGLSVHLIRPARPHHRRCMLQFSSYRQQPRLVHHFLHVLPLFKQLT